ncbi:ferritin light chain [Leptinotarsa decemlineata]|uniref:ferritin light chain n=1 Tax=Leptinotarsa decemlineata TaxID=7539 RepID=UPI000C25387F|nr:ferritin-2 heavy chain-like [Leptinotarsa decemlineata]
MKVFIVIAIFCAVASAADDYCYKDAVEACKTTNKKYTSTLNCTARYGAIDAVQPELQKFANHHFIRSFEYLLMSTHFANYEKNRAGFEKLFRSLSDSKWEEGIELIKYITKRGGYMNFAAISEDLALENEVDRSFELYELAAVAKALDFEKKFALEAHEIHSEATRKSKSFHDPEISDHLEKEFVHKQRDVIRKLAGYTTDLSDLLDGPDSSLSLFLFDEYLQKA